MHNAQKAMTSINLLNDFFCLSDSGKLFTPRENQYYTNLRTTLRDALVNLLFWHRPDLEVFKGISWVYEGFNKRVSQFEKKIAWHPIPNRIDISQPHSPSLDDSQFHDNNNFVARQAMLFLGLLPFPGQWKWLDTLSTHFHNDPEIQLFLKNEQTTIQRKLVKKNIKQLKLKNFCQILKAPNLPKEKGVLRIFSMPYLFFSCPEILKKIEKQYILYIEPAAGINFRHSWMRVYSTLDDPVLFGAASHEDANFLAAQPGIITTHLAHGDYLENLSLEPGHHKPPISPTPVAGNKNHDIVFNNTFDEMERKRHDLMLDLMNHPLLANIKVLFLGRGSEASLNEIKHKIRKRGVQNRATVVANVMRREIPSYLATCSAGVHLALQENGCRAVYEYFRANLPCVISSATAGMNMDIINAETGIVVTDEHLPRAIAEMLQNKDKFKPGKWFLKNSGSDNSTKKLNRQLKTLFQKLDYTWTADIVPLTSSGPGRYADKHDHEKFKSLFNELHKLFLSHRFT